MAAYVQTSSRIASPVFLIYDESFSINNLIATYSHVCGLYFIVSLTVICAHAECTVQTRAVEEPRTGARGPIMLHMFCLTRQYHYCRWYKLTFSDQPQVTLQLAGFTLSQAT